MFRVQKCKLLNLHIISFSLISMQNPTCIFVLLIEALYVGHTLLVETVYARIPFITVRETIIAKAPIDVTFLIETLRAIGCRSLPRRVVQISMDGPGTITWDEYLENAEIFLQMSDRISDGWEFRGDKDVPGGAYIVRRKKHFLSADNDLNYCSVHKNNNVDDDLKFELQQDPFEGSSAIEKPLVKEHHILWSMSYSVPVLYFNGWKSAHLELG
ncbi:uncharacterized protein LOC128878235 isoform X2 [Hylaeus volcanicus]|uniref:uncharacterized protein LOC128878235 isoform X2 n=1 Tax=Hylaeus volcanicus TaxID=313075 RepID=UPI0023B86330|nr:uncharacterized protein LOC128878235 isoform X2 [Hylaeus volcanicus]